MALAGVGVGYAVGHSGSTSGSPGSRLSANSSVAAQVDQGLVDINTNLDLGGQAAGTGIVLTSSGEILTNNHVIDGARTITATDVGNGRTYTASVVGYDEANDVAVLQLKGASGLSTVSLGDSSTLAVGQSVMGIGNAGGAGGTPSVAPGTITALNQTITASDNGAGTSENLHGLIQTNANIQPGDSGGPLVDSSGHIIGMDTAASQGFGDQNQAPQGYAIPINAARGIAQQIEAGNGSSTTHIGATAFLGLEIGSVPSQQVPFGGFGNGGFGFGDGGGFGNGSSGNGANGSGNGSSGNGQAGNGQAGPTGAPVAGTRPGSPAQAAGVVAGDTITSFDGKTIDSASGLTASLVPHHPGDQVQLGWVDSSGQTHSATVTLATGPAA